MSGRVLVVDDDESMVALVRDFLAPRDFDVRGAASVGDVVGLIDAAEIEAVLTDLRMPRVDGLELCRRIRSARPDVPVVLMTAFGSMETAVEAIRAGAYDFVTKPIEAETLALALGRAVAHHRLEAEVRRLRRRADGPADATDGVVSESRAMSSVLDVVRQVADLDLTVLVTGESGTGKEVVARALHRWSARRDAPFVPVNCAAIPETLLESQLFGHVRGAFTDARADRDGLFVAASGGTLFLDEIGEMPIGLQPKLLRALQERVVVPVGSSREVPFEARIVVATNRDLEAAVEAGTFREDLYYRVNVIHLELPPLRARGNDALLVAQAHLERTAERLRRPVRGIGGAAAAAILAYGWPGNVRELQNAIERAVALTRYEEIVLEDLPERVRGRATGAPRPEVDEPSMAPLEDVERRHVLGVFEAVGRNRSRAAAVLGVDPKTLYRKLRGWGVAPGRSP